MNAKTTTTSAPAPEPSDKISDARYLSCLVHDLFDVAKPHLSRKDFESIARCVGNGAFHLENIQNTVETIACDLGAEHSNWNEDNTKSLLTSLAQSIDAARAMIEAGEAANRWTKNYDELRNFYAKLGAA
jgi:hypothetical protein